MTYYEVSWSSPTYEYIMSKLERLSEPQNHRCCYCGHRMVKYTHKQYLTIPRNAVTRDHVKPKAHGGGNGINLVAACSLCNSLRGSLEAIAFFNLQQKWFRRDPTLQARWHAITHEEYQVLQRACLETHSRHLSGLGIRDVEAAFLHFRLVRAYPHILLGA